MYVRERRVTISTTTLVTTAGLAGAPAVSLARCGLIVFLANAALLVLQMVAGRLLSPLIGVSLATWTAVIGMFLAGISVGNALGGRLADRSPRPGWLNAALALGGLATLGMLGV